MEKRIVIIRITAIVVIIIGLSFISKFFATAKKIDNIDNPIVKFLLPAIGALLGIGLWKLFHK